MNLDSSGCGNQFGCTLFSLLWQLGRPVNHAFELNAHSISLSKPRAPISLATAEPFQSLDQFCCWRKHATHTRLQIRLRDAGLKTQNFEKLWHFPYRCAQVRAAV